MDLSKIPNRLRGKPYFCLMKLEQKPGKDKKDKVPCVLQILRCFLYSLLYGT